MSQTRQVPVRQSGLGRPRFAAPPQLLLRALAPLVLLLLAGVSCQQAPPPQPKTGSGTVGTRPPLPKLASGARGFDAGPSLPKAAPRLIAVGGGWGAEENPKQPALKSETARGHFELGQEYLERLDFARAIPSLEKAAALDPDYLDAYKSLGEAYAYDGVIAQEDHPDTKALLARYRQSIGAFEQARRLAPRDAELALDLGVLYFNTAQYPKAVDAFQEGLRLRTPGAELTIPLLESVTVTDVYGFMGQSYRQMGMNDRAAGAFEAALAVQPEERKWEILWELAPVYEELGAPDRALATYQRLLSEQEAAGRTPDAKAYVRIASICEARGDHEQAAEALVGAVASYEAALKEEEQYPPAADAEAAWKREWAERTASIRADLAAASYNLGAVRLALGQTRESLGPLRRAVELAPDHAGARFDLGFASLALGDKATAEAQVQPLRKTAPDLARELEERIER